MQYIFEGPLDCQNMFGWFRKQRRRRIIAQPFPAAWVDIVDNNASFIALLEDAQQREIRRSIQIIVAEKNWEGCGGLKLTDEHRVTIAAQMARMTIHFEEDYFDDVLSILIYPAAYLARSQKQITGGVIVEGSDGRLGEAWHRGPVILSWADVFDNVRDPLAQRNVVIHEFAHQLDMRNGGHADGFPVIESSRAARRWSQVMPAAFEELQFRCQHHQPSILDCYGATSPAEFFAVSSESYFESPAALEFQWPEVFELLDEFYCNRAHAN